MSRVRSERYQVTLTLTPIAPRPGNHALTAESPVARDLTLSAAPDERSFTLIGSSRISREGSASRGTAWRDFPTLCPGAIVRVVVSVTLCSEELGLPVDAWASAVTHIKQATKPKNIDLIATKVGTTAASLY